MFSKFREEKKFHQKLFHDLLRIVSSDNQFIHSSEVTITGFQRIQFTQEYFTELSWETSSDRLPYKTVTSMKFQKQLFVEIYKIVVLENSTRFTGKHSLCRSLFQKSYNIFKKEATGVFTQRYFPVNFVKLLKTIFYRVSHYDHCVKNVQIRSFFGPYFPTFRLNMDQKKLRIQTHFTQWTTLVFQSQIEISLSFVL